MRAPRPEREEGDGPALANLGSAEAIGQVFAALFAGIGSTMGHPHWALAEEEEEAIGKACMTALKSVPAAQRGKTLKAITKALPWISLTATAYVITGPRVRFSLMLLEEARLHGGATGEGTAPGNLPGPASASEPPNGRHGGADVGRILSEPF